MDKTFNNAEDSEIHKLIESLGSENGMDRQKAREALVAKGKNTIDFLMEMLTHPKHIYRWEAVKTLEEIGDPLSISLFIILTICSCITSTLTAIVHTWSILKYLQTLCQLKMKREEYS